MSLLAPSSITRPPPPPPRILLVNKFAESRAPELESLHNIVSNRLNHDFCLPRNKRRRTTSFRSRKNKWHKRRRIDGNFQAVENGGAGAVDLSQKEQSQKVNKPSRRVRRRLELRKNPAFGFCVSVDGTKRLRTHLWHAKRFTMVKRWGFYVPLGLHGRGKGSRAILRRLKSGAFVHDSSYCKPVQLGGPEESVLDIMRMLLRPFPSSSLEQSSKPVFYGACYANSMLYKDSSSLSKFIAPVIYMWRPPKNDLNSVDPEQPDGCTTSRSECCTSFRQLWIWIHPAAYNEGLDTLRCACEKQMNEAGVSVQCFPMEGHIGMLEVIGSKSLKILQRILTPVLELCEISSQSLSSSFSLSSCSSSRLQSDFVLEHAEHLPPHAIFSLEVQDPRCLSVKKSSITEESDGNKDLLLSLWSKPEANGVLLPCNRQLWNSYLNLKPPLPENVICSEKQNKRLKQFYLDSAHSGESHGVVRDNYDKSCPIILLKHADHETFGSRLSVILPLSWAKTFWMSFISNGARAIGVREKRWIACNLGLPSFPFDFPDSSAYSSLMIAESAKVEAAIKLRPRAVRPFDVPYSPPWHCVAHTLHRESIMGPRDYEESSFEHSAESFSFCIPRTLNDLNFMKERCCEEFRDQSGGLYFVRVLVHAFKEGSFEEGAVVCAPVLADLPAWMSRSDEYAPLQMPQSLVKSYFTRQDSGAWELNAPQDGSTPQWYRWPIGFITTGFVRGCSKFMAVAFCESKILKALKVQQEKEMPLTMKNEICVLVRNLKSNTYRYAVATVFLDLQEEDLDFM